jgi:membrane protease YdiL (CAAX protease family)
VRLALVSFVAILPVVWAGVLAPSLHSVLARSRSGAGRVLASLGYDVCMWLCAVAVAGSLPKAVSPPHRLGVITSLAVGLGAGAAVYTLLAGGRARLAARGLRPHRRVVVHASVFFLTTCAEEVIWRGFFMASLGSYGVPPYLALVLSTVLFAYMHQGTAGWDRVPCHVATGFLFGGVFLAAGNLLAPIAAHLTYNVAVIGEYEARRLTPTGAGR